MAHTLNGTTLKREKKLLERLESFGAFPEFWEEDKNELTSFDPQLLVAQDKEIESFRQKLESISKVLNFFGIIWKGTKI